MYKMLCLVDMICAKHQKFFSGNERYNMATKPESGFKQKFHT